MNTQITHTITKCKGTTNSKETKNNHKEMQNEHRDAKLP